VETHITNEEQLKLLQSNSRLTMKLLYELIMELKQENLTLTHRFEKMERQLTEQQLQIGEVAVTADRLVWTHSLSYSIEKEITREIAADLEVKPAEEVPECIRMSRSERHYTPKRRFFFWIL
jgi:hypothetical protein